jgi:acyl-CoA reductase-like NAD-dependent aldehyde dehydrogenase
MFRRKPHGVVLILVPFNAPVALAAAHLMPALVAGNTAVVKVPLLCPLAVTAVLESLAAALPPGAVEVVTCSDVHAGEHLVGDPRVRMIGLTGGVRTAVAVLNAVRDVKETVFELGGNDAALLLDDVPVTDSLARRLTVGALSLNGQYCSAVKRLYVHRSRLGEVAEAMTAAFARVVVGDGLDPAVALGPVISGAAAGRARELVAKAAADGARVVEGGVIADADGFAEGYFVRPTLVIDASQASAIVQQEQFAPVLPIIAYDDDEAGLAMANDNEYGLGGSVWSADIERAERLADRLAVGIAIVNGTPFDTKDLRTPFGGVSQSGIGRMLAAAGLQAYTGEFVRVHGDLNQAPDVLVGR